MDLVLVFVKCYHTEAAVHSALPLLGPETVVLTLQNGWGNAPRIASLVGAQRLLVGLTYHSGVLLGPGRVQHAGQGMTYVGELDGRQSERLKAVTGALAEAGFQVTPTERVLQEIRQGVRDSKRVGTCLEFGPRFLHSTGQGYKGGPNTGVFLILTGADRTATPVPETEYSFSVLKYAQALGDFGALEATGRTVHHCHLPDPPNGLDAALHDFLEHLEP